MVVDTVRMIKDKMIKLASLLENFGGPGKMVLPSSHKAGMRVAKGGSCCANCLYWNSDKEICTNEYYQKWAGTATIPYPANEYCTNWWEPIPKSGTEDEETDSAE